ncbi:hypothetical protein QQM39_26220 [Streptomyces sp. DT2A-34]|uniref:hypothetical protein n=1 Tax=Streptomyces sp. DT2A-34 TaxID=3051182 RepID=UPI00265C82F2|nr:hypothetical protein [Streptomyces sp. DT2A-34]MDO0914197.1 hypothetical protein [Streptomyces sp. DT2A-34]
MPSGRGATGEEGKEGEEGDEKEDGAKDMRTTTCDDESACQATMSHRAAAR